MTSFRPSAMDLIQMKKPLGLLIRGPPSETMPKLKSMIQEKKPPKVVTVGDIVSRETSASGISVSLRIVDQMTLRKAISRVEIAAERKFSVKNPAGVITKEAWEVIKEALREKEAVISVDGEEDLLAIPAILESPENGFVVYGQPSQGLVVVTVSPKIKGEVSAMMSRMTEE